MAMRDMRPGCRRVLALAGLCLLLPWATVSTAATAEFEIVIRDHLFFPAELTIPSGVKVRLRIINEDETPEEFESFELNREKVILGKRSGVVFIGPLQAGEYPFFGEFYPKTAQGKIIVVDDYEASN